MLGQMERTLQPHFGHARGHPGPRVLGRSFWDNRVGIERAPSRRSVRSRHTSQTGARIDPSAEHGQTPFAHV